MSADRERSQPSESDALKKIWDGSFGSSFVAAFGQPTNASHAGDKLTLHYPKGDKVVSVWQAADHLLCKPTKTWRHEGDEIRVQFDLAVCPSVQTWKRVGKWSNGHVTLFSDFDALPPAFQTAILQELREQLPSPEEAADVEWNIRLDGRGTSGNGKPEQMVQELIWLQAPGELGSRSSLPSHTTVTERWTTHDGEVSHEADRRVASVNAYLIVGGRRRAQSHWSGDWTGGHEFFIQGELAQDLEAYRQRLIEERRHNLSEMTLAYADAPEERITGIPEKIYSERYEKRWAELVHEAGFDRKEVEGIAIERTEFAQREKLVALFMQLRGNVEQIEKRLGAYRIEKPDQPFSWADPAELEMDSLHTEISKIQAWIDAAEAAITQTLEGRGEREIGQHASAEEATRELAEAMAQPAKPATWYLKDITPDKLAGYGRKPGEGFGDCVAGKKVYLPGDRPIVGMTFGGGTSRYRTDIKTRGLISLADQSIPEHVYKGSATLLAIAKDPTWFVQWTRLYDGKPRAYGLATADGTSEMTIYPKDDGQEIRQVVSHGWKEDESAGPTEEEICVAHGLLPASVKPESKVLPVDHTQKIVEPAPMVLVPKKEGRMTTFKYQGGRDFLGACGHSTRVNKADAMAYQSGQTISLECGVCHAAGEARK